jgi:alpha-L-rhamnosidase
LGGYSDALMSKESVAVWCCKMARFSRMPKREFIHCSAMSFAVFVDSLWIASPLVGSPHCGVPAPYVRTSFLISRPFQSAVLKVTALGLYECEINGHKVSDHALAPGWTDYRRRVYYQTLDVTGLLQLGENAIGALLGDGWYCGAVGWKPRQIYGDRPRFLAHLEVIFSDGEREIIRTSEKWKTAVSPVLQNDLLSGETYDARRELSGWSNPGFDDSGWGAVAVLPCPEIAVEPPPVPPVRRINEIRPVVVVPVPHNPSAKIVDFGQNFSGRVRLSVKGEAGQTFKIRHSEVLSPDGTVYIENLRGVRATDFYTCKGGAEETWEPFFTFHGFRYAEISGLKEGQMFEMVGVVLHSDTAPTGSFACSNPLVNQLQSNIQWGQKSNFLDVPTDCPQRDERLGWTGDAQVFIRTACFNMDVRGFFHKWMQDLRDGQHDDGAVPPVAPDNSFVDGIHDGGPGWSDAMIICPWTIYLCYGDTTILKDNYAAMQRFMGFLDAKRCKDHIRSHPEVDEWGGFGDWLALDGSGDLRGATRSDLIGTAFYAYDAEIMSKVAFILGFAEDAERYDALHEEIVQAFRRRFVTPEGLVAAATQTAYVLALRFGLIPEESRAKAANELVRLIERREFHIGTGFLGTPYILDVLVQNGYLEVAYKLLEQETFPSWLFPVRNGATTIWERWDGWTPASGFQDKGMNSFNHYAYGAVGDWMYRVVAGIDVDPEQPGYQHIVFRPRPGGSITWAEAELQLPAGKATIRWTLSSGGFQCTVTVPEGCRASFHAPNEAGRVVLLEAGKHEFCSSVPAA